MRTPALVVTLVCLALSVGLGEDALAQEDLEINDRTVPEGNTGPAEVTLTVTLSDEAKSIVTVDYETEDVAAPTATGGATCAGATDYITEEGTLQFAVGEDEQSVSVTVCGDAVVESDEAFRVRLSNASGATIEEATGRVTLTNDDVAAALPTLSINDVTAPEGNTGTTARQFTVTLSAASNQAVTVQFTYVTVDLPAPTRDAACGAGIDVALAASGTLTFSPSVTTQTIPFTVCGDVVDELDETFEVRLSNPVGATIADGTGPGTITDDDPLPSLSINDVTAAEGNSGTTSRQFTVTLSAASGRRVQFGFAVTPANDATRGTACGAGIDVALAASGFLSFSPSVTTQAIPFTVCGDVVDESDETFDLRLSSPSGATIADGTGRGTITDDDRPPPIGSPSLAINDVTAAEGNTGTTSRQFTVKLSAASGQGVTVQFTFFTAGAAMGSGIPCSAGGGPDLTLGASGVGTLTFSPSVTTQAIPFTVCGDVVDESDETFEVRLSNPVGATIADGTGRGTITDDD